MPEPAYMTYDSGADVLYLRLLYEDCTIIEQRDFGNERYVDYDDQARVVGVQFIGASAGIDLEGMPEADAIRAALNSFPRA